MLIGHRSSTDDRVTLGSRRARMVVGVLKQTAAFFVAFALLVVGCADGSDSDSASTSGADSDVPVTVSPEGADGASEVPVDSADDGPELPAFASDFDRLCTTQVGFAGATPLAAGPGPHPMVLFEETDSGILITTSKTLPAGWLVVEDSNFDDNSDLAPTELVGCSQITAQTPNGVSCDLEDDEGKVTTLDLVDVTYELTVYEATTGAVVGTETLAAASTDCPTFVFIDDDQTQFFNSPDADAYTNAVKAYITPA